jgi:outer membrane protein assembly factor BamB
MNARNGLGAILAMLLSVHALDAQDWPQWRGPNRDAKAAGFKAPKSWPDKLTQKWKITVGDGVATPALVGDKLFVFTRENGNEIIRCVKAADGVEVWSDKYSTEGVGGPASGFAGPRSSPAVADGKVVTLGVHGILSCYDAEKGTKLWRKEDIKGEPVFAISSSPIIVDALVITQFGGGRGGGGGGIIAHDLAKGEQKWKWSGEGAAYASPSVLTVGDDKVIIAETTGKIVAVSAKDGKLMWETPFTVSKGGYNAASPMVDGQMVLYAGSSRGTTAVKLEKKDNGLAAKDVWTNKENSVVYNTPVIKDGVVYALSGSNSLFCINSDGTTGWTHELGGGGKGGGKGMGRGGYGNIVDAGSVLMAITPKAELIIFEPSAKEYKEIKRYPVSSGGTYAYPILSGNRIFIKDSTSLILFITEPEA